MKIAVITCYKQTDYVRAHNLIAALKNAPQVELIDIRNERINWLRFFEVMLKITKARLTDKPDAYLLTFRGYEMLLFAVLTGIRKPIIFDEQVNFTEWLLEHHRLKEGSLSFKLFRSTYGWFIRQAKLVLADTAPHAAYSASLNKLSLGSYQVIPVGANDEIFYPRKNKSSKDFVVFYYVFSKRHLPLHGLDYLVRAALELKDEGTIRFHIAGGGKAAARLCLDANAAGANIRHELWLPIDKLAEAAARSSLTIGGPLGNTLQSRFVVTGKTYQFLALAKPVVIGRNEANQVFKDKQNCLVIKQADTKSLVKAITWAKAHPKELERIATNGRKLYSTQFALPRIKQDIAQMLNNVT